MSSAGVNMASSTSDSSRTLSTSMMLQAEHSEHANRTPPPLPPSPPPSCQLKKSRRKLWKKLFRRKYFEEGQRSDWWFASLAIPLLAATLGPLANVSSIGALVTFWRMDLIDENGERVGDLDGTPFQDPKWCYWINVTSLIFGFVGNVFLLLNFTQRVRYKIALPMTIICWYLATGLLVGILIAMNIHIPPIRPEQTYTQGFWYAVAAASIYLISAMLLMVNMLGYFKGHYPDAFTLTEHQRTLILQTMLFFVWLAGGGAVFSRIETDHGEEGWAFVDALYFCDVTILTVGFGDLAPTTDLARGLVFPYSVIGIITLGLVITSIHKFVRQLGEDKVIHRRFEKVRQRTWERTVRSSTELERRVVTQDSPNGGISSSFDHEASTTAHSQRKPKVTLDAAIPFAKRVRKPKLLVLREEKDRFEQMRKIERKMKRFKKWWALTLSVLAFGILWAVGAVVFWQAEKGAQGMTYFQALYFCYISLLTIGYGDMSPRSNPGRCFFVVWSLIAVPTMTVLISDMGDTVISSFKRGSNVLGDFTVLPRSGLWREFLNKHPWLLMYIQSWIDHRAQKRRMKEGIPVGPPPESDDPNAGENTIENIAEETEANEALGKDLDEVDLAHRLANAIKRTAFDTKVEGKKRYTYEEWVEFTRLIRFTSSQDDAKEVDDEEETEGLVEWDWIGEDSPMMGKQSEPEFVLDRLCDSLVRFAKRRHAQRAATHAESSIDMRETSGTLRP